MYTSILSSGQVPSPTSTYTVQTFLDNTDVGQPLYKIVCHVDEFKDCMNIIFALAVARRTGFFCYCTEMEKSKMQQHRAQ